ncbi:trefoil factor 3 [Microtus pennsylvanicus]|uniref:trefoil factor 3 n=1 Tax=Microtus pennsylvanicus TaxID=10058 RepID=UPI003F6D6AE6
MGIKGPCLCPCTSCALILKLPAAMETRALCLMLLVLLAGSSGVAAEYIGLSPSQCQVPAKVRVDCGYPSVSKEECNNRGCCFDNSIRNVPWCFKPLQEAECTF